MGRRVSPRLRSGRLRHITRAVQPFFTSLSGRPIDREGQRRVLTACQTALTRAVSCNVRYVTSLAAFVRGRSTICQTFLSHLPSFSNRGLSSVARSARQYYTRMFLTTRQGSVACHGTVVCLTVHAGHELVRGIQAYVSSVYGRGIGAPTRTRTCV